MNIEKLIMKKIAIILNSKESLEEKKWQLIKLVYITLPYSTEKEYPLAITIAKKWIKALSLYIAIQ